MNSEKSIRVYMDVDTGIDDALAILLAVKHPALDVRGITTVVGNVDLEQVTRNTLPSPTQIVLCEMTLEWYIHTWSPDSISKATTASLAPVPAARLP